MLHYHFPSAVIIGIRACFDDGIPSFGWVEWMPLQCVRHLIFEVWYLSLCLKLRRSRCYFILLLLLGLNSARTEDRLKPVNLHYTIILFFPIQRPYIYPPSLALPLSFLDDPALIYFY